MGSEGHSKAQSVGGNYCCNGTGTLSQVFFQTFYPLLSCLQLASLQPGLGGQKVLLQDEPIDIFFLNYHHHYQIIYLVDFLYFHYYPGSLLPLVASGEGGPRMSSVVPGTIPI